MNGEIWKDVKGYEGYYKVSNMGQVMSCDRTVYKNGGSYIQKGRILKQGKSKHGYMKLTFSVNNTLEYISVHQLVAEHFLKKPRVKGIQVNHINNIRHDNRVENLEWVTPKENIQHAAKQGRLACVKGSNNGAATVTENMVVEIREKYATRNYYFKELASEYGQTFQNISLIVRGKIWSHVGGPISEDNRSRLNKRYKR